MAVRTKATTQVAAKAVKKPVKKVVKKPVVEEVVEEKGDAVYGVSDIVALLAANGQTTTTRELRTLLRKMARDGRLDREIVAGNRARWEFAGPEDPQVQAIIAAFNGGELEADKKEKLQALKERKAAQIAAKKAAEAEAEAEEEVEDDEEELEEDDDE